MKTLVKITFQIIVLVIFTMQCSFAQEAKVTLKSTSLKKVTIAGIEGDLTITTHKANEILIKTNNMEPLPERAKGLKPVYYTGCTDNTGVGIEVKEINGMVTISGASPHAKNGEFSITIPESLALDIEYESFQAGDLKLQNISKEIVVAAKISDIEMKNITGPIVAHTLSGDITCHFSTLYQENPTSITSVSGDIDITLPAESKADLSMKSISGEIYSNFEINVKKEEDMYHIGGQVIDAQINSGGVDFQIEAISGNIYLRKK